MSKTVALIRTYNNPTCLDFLRQLKSIGVENIVVVIDAQRDNVDTFRNVSLGFASDRHVTIVNMHRYGWSAALNAAIKVCQKSYQNCDFLVCSTDVLVSQDLLCELKLAKDATQWCGFVFFRNRDEESYLIPRNTCCLWHFSAFDEVGLFDEDLDQFQGMEDYEMCLRGMQLQGRLPKAVSIQPDLGHRFGLDHEAKSRREIIQMRHIETKFLPSTIEVFRKHIQKELQKIRSV